MEGKRSPTLRRLDRAVDRAFPELDGGGQIDPLEAEFRLNSVWTGAWMTLIVCAPALIYGLTGGGRSDRALYWSVWAVGLSGGLIAFLLPWRRIIRSRWREAAFLIWTILDLLLIGAAIGSDGGPASPLTVLLFPPIILVGASYPTGSVKLVTTLGVLGYAGLAIAYSEPFGRATIVLGGLIAGSMMSWWEARNHELRRRQLALVSITDPLTGTLNRRSLAAESRPLATRIRAACAEHAPHCTGIASAPADGHDFDSLYRAADRALYEAKRHRGARVAHQRGSTGPAAASDATQLSVRVSQNASPANCR